MGGCGDTGQPETCTSRQHPPWASAYPPWTCQQPSPGSLHPRHWLTALGTPHQARPSAWPEVQSAEHGAEERSWTSPAPSPTTQTPQPTAHNTLHSALPSEGHTASSQLCRLLQAAAVTNPSQKGTPIHVQFQRVLRPPKPKGKLPPEAAAIPVCVSDHLRENEAVHLTVCASGSSIMPFALDERPLQTTCCNGQPVLA